MGCGSSTAAITQEKDSPLSNNLEKKLISAIVGTKRRKSFKVKKSSFNNLMLQFPKLRNGFKKVRECYKQLQPTGTLEWGDFKANCSRIGLDPSSVAVKEVFNMDLNLPDTAKVTTLDLTCIFTVVYLLDSNKKTSIQYPEVKNALEILEKAFTFFDSSSDGCIERKEMALAMKSGTRVFGRKASKSLADRLFDELDWDGSGRITFKEFLTGIEKIVMEDFESDEDEDEDLVDEAEDEEEEEDNDLKALDEWEDEGEGHTRAGGTVRVAPPPKATAK